ncbi:hypothetical protein [Ketogulonicigenium vulgare]|uniref:DUF2125 domain-containing protein n=1 Tax=Ketogulonicigenium vulgare (strain WSH-001) TaxID=759362 RepID=F9Y6M0_KETVW|nr:hypothetical protein [Ketogulonicigenium vulgare]ADO43882.1 conserved hypothetical protein [Ketogulonicigenium vulgare Y25]AEM42140.1 hypothetical protein KVU_2301 [Ketogulonicigenium vulgare WSH-001]ALJ79765.1 hypothetical protein KVH_00275 [Ketogulonicigenium vulgare]ANW32685.1 hypothetical protein KvSKV_00285 [Ketogulonicigenium vulgare]AOZ55916.1 hypothetical protein KVC_2914 [Ketogulonicigenium vulgare]
MSRFHKVGGAAALALVLANPAYADLTADQLWDATKAGIESAVAQNEGLSVTIGTENRTGDTVTLADIAIIVDSAPTYVAVNIPSITLTSRPDGTVLMDQSDSYDFEIRIDDPESTSATPDQITLKLVGFQENDETIFSGTLEDLQIAYSVPRSGIRMPAGGLSISGADAADVPQISGELTYSGLAGTLGYKTEGALLLLDSDMTIASAALSLKVVDPQEGTFTLNGAFAEMNDKLDVALPLNGLTSMQAAYDNGLRMEQDSTVGASSFDFTMRGPYDMPMDGNMTIGSLTSTSNISRDLVAMDFAMGDVALSSSMTGPLGTIGRFEMGFDMAFAETADLQPYAITTKITDLVASDMIWAMVDPGGQLPRDPASMDVTLNGEWQVQGDVFDEAALASGAATIIPRSFGFAPLNISALGASITGGGTFELGPDMDADMPITNGSAEFTLIGIDALLQKLNAMGLIPPDAAMGATFALQGFTTQVDPQTRTTKIEVNNGVINLNGMVIPGFQ